MKQFQYKVIDKTGKKVSGTIESLDEKHAIKILQERGLVVVSLTQKKEFSLTNLFPKTGNKVSARDVAVFTRLLATMIQTGLPLSDALANLANQFGSSYFSQVIRSIQNDIQSGDSLSASMSRYPEIFNNLYVNLVKAGEASGKVGETMEDFADTLEADLEFKSKVRGALIYPAIIVTAMGGIGAFMVTTIIPQISTIYSQFNAELPLPTKILIGISMIIRNYLVLVLAAIALLAVGYRILRNNKVSDYWLNNLRYRVPIFGPLENDTVLTILNRTLATLLSSGVAILDALNIVAATMVNDHFRSGIEACAKAVEKGLPLSQTLHRYPQFPLMMAQLAAIGEQTGTLDQSLARLAKFYQEAAERRVKTVTSAMEPIIILVMGLSVGGLAIAVLLPMFNLVNVIK
ncbi:MAG: type II secretion system F family protein [Patescibacteria group bacterium]|nr:type II secretion system F family protein [Patescibacteria group bacterium]MCL5432090.1 type II secretion system F family protein [Patescibacteria group bacterium]